MIFLGGVIGLVGGRVEVFSNALTPTFYISVSITSTTLTPNQKKQDNLIYKYRIVLYIYNKYTRSIDKKTKTCPKRDNDHILFYEQV